MIIAANASLNLEIEININRDTAERDLFNVASVGNVSVKKGI